MWMTRHSFRWNRGSTSSSTLGDAAAPTTDPNENADSDERCSTSSTTAGSANNNKNKNTEPTPATTAAALSVDEEKKEESGASTEEDHHHHASDESAAAAAPTSSSTSPAELDPETIKLNEAFTALEAMRWANLEMELHTLCPTNQTKTKIDPRHCVTCLRREAERRHAHPTGGGSSWGWHKRKAIPCLVCAAPTCRKHAAPAPQKDPTTAWGGGASSSQSSSLTICRQCAPLFGLDFMVDLIQYGDADPQYRRKKVDQLVDSYDRALIVLKYLRQFIDSTCEALEQTAARDNKIGLGSSATGLVSGMTGLTAAAIHFAAMSSAMSVVAAATVLSPVGPPLLLASIALGGTAAAASSGSEAVSYYSEPNQLANRIMALHELIHSLLNVTVTLRDALTRGHINLDMYLGNNSYSSRSASFREHDEGVIVRSPSSAADEKDGLHRSNSTNSTGSDNLLDDINLLGDTSKNPTKMEEPPKDPTSPASADSDQLSSPQAPESPNTKTKVVTRTSSSSNSNIRSAVTRTCTNTLKAAQVASAACGVLSVASIIMEAKNMTDVVQRMKAGNRHPKVDILRAIQQEIDKLPDTALILEQCESYLQHEAEQDDAAAERHYEEEEQQHLSHEQEQDDDDDDDERQQPQLEPGQVEPTGETCHL